MKKYISLVFKFISLSWMRDMEYRANFVAWMLIDIGWSFMDFLFTLVLINFTQTLGHWSKGDMFIVLGLFRLLIVPVWGWMFQSFSLIPKYISEGNLDYILAKPIDSQFLVSFRQFGFSIIPSLVAGIAFIVYGFKLLGTVPSLVSLLLFLWIFVVSVFLIYGFYFSIIALSLYVERLNNIQHIFPSLFDASRYPAEIFSPILRLVFTTLVPISLIVVVPAQALFSPVSFPELVYIHFLAIAFFVLSRQIWLRGLRRYSSASS